MLRRLLEMVGWSSPERDGRQFARDARAIIEMVHGQHAADNLRAIAETAKRQIAEVHQRGLDDPAFYRRGVTHLTDLNRAARSRRDYVTWSGITLAIIYIKSEMIGDDGISARNAIDGYFEHWSHVDEPMDGPQIS